MYNTTVFELYSPLRYVRSAVGNMHSAVGNVRSAVQNIKRIPVPYKYAHSFFVNITTRIA